MQRQPGKQGSHQTRCDRQEILFNFLKCLTNTRNFPLDCIDTNVYKLYLLDIYKCVQFVFQIYIRIWYISWFSNKMKGNDTEYMWTYCWKKEKKKVSSNITSSSILFWYKGISSLMWRIPEYFLDTYHSYWVGKKLLSPSSVSLCQSLIVFHNSCVNTFPSYLQKYFGFDLKVRIRFVAASSFLHFVISCFYWATVFLYPESLWPSDIVVDFLLLLFCF